jgi:uncharacterized protein
VSDHSLIRGFIVYFVVYCKDKPGNLRNELRAAHLQHIIDNPHPYRFGGPLIGENGVSLGSLFILEAADRGELDRLMAADPYFKGNLYASVEIHPTYQVIPELAPGLLARELRKEVEKVSRT